MWRVLLVLLGAPAAFSSSSECPDWSGHWETEIEEERVSLYVEQEGCERAIFRYRLQNGFSHDRELIFDGKLRRQFEAGWEALDEAFERKGNLVKKWGRYEDREEGKSYSLDGWIREDGPRLVETTEKKDSDGRRVELDEVRFYRVP